VLRTITEARDRLTAARTTPAAVPREELERAVRQWFFQLWDRCEAAYLAEPSTTAMTDEMVEQAELELAAFAEPDEQARGMLLFQAEKMLAERGYQKPRYADVELLASYIRRGYGLVNRAVIDHYRNHRFHHAIDDPLFDRKGDASSQDRSTAKVASVAELIAKFKSDPQRQKLSPKNALGFLMSFRLLEEIAGAIEPITGVSRGHAREIQSLLSKLPPNATKRFRGTPLKRVAKLAEEGGMKPMEAGTAENILRNLSAFFAWVVREHYVSRNPFEGLRPLQDEKRAEERRQPFDERALVAIFSSPLFADRNDAGRPVSAHQRQDQRGLLLDTK
jgi:hypothetical protein